MKGPGLLEQPSEGIFGDEVNRVRFEESRLKCTGFRPGGHTPSTVGNLDPTPMDLTEREDAFAEGVHDRGHP